MRLRLVADLAPPGSGAATLPAIASAVKRDPWLPAILLVSAALGLFHLNWGLPNGSASWAGDAPGPLTILNVVWRQLRDFNSGWFWFKYPFGYPLLLAIAYSPYLAWVWLSGGLHAFSTAYPYGLNDPERVLYVLAMIGRCVNVALITGTVALTYAIAKRLLGRRAGLLAAWFAATAYPLVYYAHTNNQDPAYLFWLTLALWATLVAAEEGTRRAHLLLGFAAAMAMATKEQGFALVLTLPVLLVAAGYRRQSGGLSPASRIWQAAFNSNTLAGLAASVLTFAIASNAILNPLGVWNRIQDLRGHPSAGLSARPTPVEFSFFKGLPKESFYLRSLVDVLDSSLGTVLLLVAVLGAGYLLFANRRAAVWLLLPAAAYYVLSLRTHDVLMLRYALPLLPLLAATAAAACVAVWDARPRLGMVLAGTLCLLALGRAVEVEAMLLNDPRYAAEQWMRDHGAAGSSVEVYQQASYLPRLPGFSSRKIALAERSVDQLLTRQPDFLVISSAGRKQVMQKWNKEWRQGESLLVEEPAAAQFLAALEHGELPYRMAAQFAAPAPLLVRLRITSLSPQISIYARQPPQHSERG